MKAYLILASCAALCAGARASAAQSTSLSLGPVHVLPLVTPGSPAEERERLDQLRGIRPAGGWLLRTPVTLAQPLAGDSAASSRLLGCALRWAAVAPRADLTYNSRIPFDRNDEAVWAGAGATVRVSAGWRAECGRVRAVVVPEIWHAQNRAFPLIGPQEFWLSGWASPFYSGREASADLPVRFGSQPITMIDPGISALEVDAPWVTVGAGSQPQWWGPGIHDALLMSTHAGGVPSVYLRTNRPVTTPWFSVEARWMVGALSESPYFDFNAANDLRSLSGIVFTVVPRFDTTLTLGAERVVYASIPSAGALPARFFDAVARWGEGANVRYATSGRAAEQMTGFFGRWIFPADGVEAYAEWARVLLPTSLRSFLVAPQYSQGYTVGSQWISSTDTLATAWHVGAEFSMVEQPRLTSEEPPAFYVSPIVPQGYTQRGQVIGALIGPGGSGQFIDFDRIRRTWSAGVFAGRIRWNHEQYYRRPTSFLNFAQDVSLYTGVRGTTALRGFDLSAELVREKRYNFLFQNKYQGYQPDHTFDVANLSLRLAVTPR